MTANLQNEIRALRDKLREAEETLEAVRSGDVDAVVFPGRDGMQHVYALETADQAYRMLVEDMREGALTVSLEDKVLYCNPKLSAMLGLEASDILGNSLSRFVMDHQRPGFMLVVQTRGKAEFTICTPDGREIPAHFSFSILHGTNGRPDSLCCIVTDLTEQHRADEELKAAHQRLITEIQERERTESMLRQSQKMEAIGQLTGGVAHDFNNLLMAISGGLSMLDRNPDPERLQKLKAGMRQAVDRGASLTKQLLGFSRTKALDARVIDVASQIEGMREILDRSLGGSIKVTANYQIGLWPVRVDVGEFELFLLNLCLNARDAMPSGGSITIGARNLPGSRPEVPNGDFVVITVADTGTGMSEETRARAFEPFFTTKDVGKGSGLGLAQAYGFARSSGGTLQIVSHLGRGTKIELLLPRSVEPSLAPISPAPLPFPVVTAPNSALGRVLLVEDDDGVADFTGEMLVSIGFGVTHAPNATEALHVLANGNPFNLVFSDVMMPGGMNGVQLAHEIRRAHKGLPILLTSGHASAFADQVASSKLELLPKPFSLDDLTQSVYRQLGRSHLRSPVSA